MHLRASFHARRRAALIAAVAVVGFAHFAQGTTKTWIGGTSNWNNSVNWSPINRPASGDLALVRQSGAVVTYDVTSAPFDIGSIILDTNSTILQSAPTSQLNLASFFVGNSSAGTYNISNGSLSATGGVIVGQSGGGNGTVVMSGGNVIGGSENIGVLGNGSFIQTGGTHAATAVVIAGSTGNGFYRLDGGVLDVSAGSVNVGNHGSFTSNGVGSLSSATTFYLNGGAVSGSVSSNGTFISNSGTLAANVGTTLINSGTFIYNGGDNSNWQFSNTGRMIFNNNWTAKALYSTATQTIDFGARTITLNLAPGATNVPLGVDSPMALNGGILNVNNGDVYEQIGSTGTGIFFHNSGTNNAANLRLGGSTNTFGSYYLGSGTLNVVSSSLIGSFGAGTFGQNGGNHTTNRLYLGEQSIGSGTYLMSGGSLNVTGLSNACYVGYNGTGFFQQTRGDVSAQYLVLAFNPSSSGTYQIFNGANLTVSSLTIADDNSAKGTFTQVGGQVVATGSIALAGFGATSQGVYSMQNGTLSSSEIFVGDIGSGTFTQSAGANSTGTITIALFSGSSGIFTLAGGSLSVTNSVNLNPNSQFVQTGGALTVGSFNITGPVVSPYTFTGGLLHLTNSNLSIGAAGLLGANVSTSPTRSIITDKATSLDALGLLTIAGGTFSTGSFITNGGSVALQSGTLALTGSGLTIGSAQPLGASVKLDYGATISISGSNVLTVDPGAIVQLNGGAAIGGGTFFNNGQIVLSSPLASLGGATLSNAGLLNGSGRVTSRLLNQSAGEVRADATDSLQFQNNLNSSAGKFTLNGGRIEFTQDLTLTSTATVVGRGTLIASNGLSNAGTMTFSGSGNSDVFGAVTNTNRINVTGGNTTTFWNNVNTSAGTINVNANSTVVFAGNLTGQSHIAGPGTKDYEGTASGGPIATVVGDTLVGAPAVVSADYLREDDVQVFGSLAIAPSGSPSNVSVANTLSIPSGKLDLTNNDLIVTSTPLPTIAADITSAYNTGSWNGTGLTSSHAAAIAADSSNLHKTALGYATASSLGINSFDGQSVSGANVLVRYTYTGDANLDGVVNALDFNAIATNFGGSNKLWFTGDFNYDGSVNTADFTALAQNFNQVLPAPALGALVPEPAIVALGALAWFIARPGTRRRH